MSGFSVPGVVGLLAGRPWIDHPSCAAWVAHGAFGDQGGRALQLHQEGFCVFQPSDSEWLDLVATARQEAFLEFKSDALRQLAIHSELADLLTLLYGRQAYASVIENTKTFSVSAPHTLINQCQSQPSGFFCGAFIALEDIDVDEKALCLYPGSHRYSSFCSESSLSLQQQLELSGLAPSFIKVARGDVVIVHSQLVHYILASGTSCRYSWAPIQTFFFEGCRLIDSTTLSQSKEKRYIKCIDLSTSGLRPNWRDCYLMVQKASDEFPVSDAQSLDLAGQPLVDRRDFDHLLSHGQFGSFTDLAQQLNSQGFSLLTIQDPDWLNLLDEVRENLEPYVDLKRLAKGTLDPIRFQDAWSHQDIAAVRQVACHPEILASLQVLYGRAPFPFQTLNFPNGTAQHFHSDAVHFHSLPHGFMCGVWVALEDISVESGPLVYYPGSHRLPYLAARDFGLNQAQVLAEPAPQKFFEQHWRDCVAAEAYPRCLFEARKGDVLVWHANLLHGGSPVRRKTLSRWSQVTHYFFEGCAYTTPLFQTIDAPVEGHQWRSPIPIRPVKELTNA